METSIAELLTYYVIGGALIIGPPAIFLIIAMMAALHKFGDISFYENAPTDQTKFYLTLGE